MQKLLRICQTFASSCLTVALIFLLNLLACTVVSLLVEVWVIPTLSRFSYDMHLYFERMETLPTAISDGIIFASSLLGLLPSTVFAVRWNRGRRNFFVKQTSGLISYADGYRFYFKHYGISDGIAVVLASAFATLWFVKKGKWLYPIGYTFYKWFGLLGGWFMGTVFLAAAVAGGVFFAQRNWRATYLSEQAR